MRCKYGSMQQRMCRVSISLKINIAYEEIPMAVRAVNFLSPIIPAGHPPDFLKTQAENQGNAAEDNGASKRCLPWSQMFVREISSSKSLIRGNYTLIHFGSFGGCFLKPLSLCDPLKCFEPRPFNIKSMLPTRSRRVARGDDTADPLDSQRDALCSAPQPAAILG